MYDKKQQRIIALAGVFQSASLVAQLAQHGQCDNTSTNALINSLFIFKPNTFEDVYNNNINPLKEGLQLLSTLASNKVDNNHADIIRYALSLLALQKQLQKNPDMMNLIQSRLSHIDFNKTHFSEDNHQLISSVSALYQETLSTLKFRIQVNGNMTYLKQTHISDKVRTLLFTGIRSAMLWRQLGGTKWQIIFGRSDIEKQSRLILSNLNN